MDMMEVGNGMTEEEDRAHFSLWAIMASPLIAGNDLRNMSEATKKILTHKDTLAINQDKLGVQAMKWIDEGDFEIFVKPLEKGEFAFLFLNRADAATTYSLDWAFHYMKDDISKHEIFFDKKKFNWRDIWSDEKGSTAEKLTINVPAHGVRVLRLIPQ
jgi:alpha-galactosidase